MDRTERTLARLEANLLKVENVLHVAETVAALLRALSISETGAAMQALEDATVRGSKALEKARARVEKLRERHQPHPVPTAGEA
jgi:hypothetical protein